MKSISLVTGLKAAACIGVGCGGTLGVQHYTASFSSQEEQRVRDGKSEQGKNLKFEVNQLSKQLEEKEQSLKTWEELLAKKDADLKEQQAAMASVQTQAAIVGNVAQTATVTELKPEQAIIDEAPFGEEGAKSGKLKASNIAQRGIAKREAEVPTSDVPKRPAVFDGGGAPTVAFPSTTDVVTVKEGSDIPETLKAGLERKDRESAALRARLMSLENEAKAYEQNAADLRTLNEDLKRELEETGEKLAKAEANAKEKVPLSPEPERSISFDCLRANEWEDSGKRSEYLKGWLSQKGLLPKDGSFAVCRLKPKEASHLWNFGFPMLKWVFDACLNNRRGALAADMACNKKINSSDLDKCFSMEPIAMYACLTEDPDGGVTVKKGKDKYSVRPQSREWLCCLFCPCKRRTNEIRKLKYEEVAVEVESEENWQRPKIPELSDVLSPKEQRQFEKLLPEINGKSFVSLDNNEAFEPNKDDEDHGVYSSYEELGEPVVGNKYRTIFFVFEPCFRIWDGLKKAKSAFFGK